MGPDRTFWQNLGKSRTFPIICKAICTVIQEKYHQFPKMFDLWEEYFLNCCNFVSNLSFSWKFLVSDRQYNHSEPCKAHCRHPFTENVMSGQDARGFFCAANLLEREPTSNPLSLVQRNSSDSGRN